MSDRSTSWDAPATRRTSSVSSLLSRYVPADLGSPLVKARRRVGARAVARLFERASRLGQRFAKDADPARHGVEVLKDIAYLHSGLDEHRLDIYRPIAREAPLPLVFYVHGGAFRSLSKDTHWIMGLAFSRRGFVVANTNYRLAPQHRFPAAIEDVAEAFRFAVQNAPSWGADPTRVIFAGESAGANLITALACSMAYDRDEPYARVARSVGVVPQAVLAACGVFQVSDGARFNAQHGNNWFFEDRYAEIGDDYLPLVRGKPTPHDLADVVCLLERERPVRPLPPFFLPVGELDHLKDDHARMETALKRWGVEAEVRVYPKAPHAFHAFVPWDTAKACWRDQFAFLERHGFQIKRGIDY